jgi:alanyl-tRNA synthetase
MSGNELREKFLKFFEKRDHTIVPSSSLIPDDPSVLLTTAGMQQFKPYYSELDPETTIHPSIGKPVGKNAASVQKSFRTSDIDEVGDESHLTFFEMLGNFSFGGYFKEKAIEYAYDFITRELGLKIGYVSIFDPAKVDKEDWRAGVPFDEDSYKIWQKIDPKLEIRKEGVDNFWGPTGKEGPCGPTTEIYIKDIEIWNIVFNEYYCDSERKLTKLKSPGVDTGMGFERLAMVIQGKKDIFETDLFQPIISSIIFVVGDKPIEKLRLIADHLKAATFLIAEGVVPSNTERGYILRRLIRRAMLVHYRFIGAGMDSNFYVKPVKEIIGLYSEQYRELRTKESDIITVLQFESEKFSKALERGLKQFERYSKDGKISAREAFDLYQSYGFPLESTEDLLEERVIKFDRDKLRRGFDQLQVEHIRTSSTAAHKKFGGHGLILDTGELKAGSEEEVEKITRLHTATHLLNQALNDILGEEIEQRGSDINPERTRFDFTFSRKVTREELDQVENIVNDKIKEGLPVIKKEMSRDEAFKSGARAFFKEKYPEKVSVYFIGDSDKGEVYSKEFCGGPHVSNTREIGNFKILKEESSSAGVRRIRAIVEF